LAAGAYVVGREEPGMQGIAGSIASRVAGPAALLLPLALTLWFASGVSAHSQADSSHPPVPERMLPLVSNASCSKKACHAVITCKTQIAPDTQCQVVLSLLSRTTGQLNENIFPWVDGEPHPTADLPEQHTLNPGESKRITLPMNSVGRKRIKAALGDGLRKLKGGKWAAAVEWSDDVPLMDFHPFFHHHRDLAEGPVRIRLKGKGGSK
jgi:hypothetical protein